MRRVIVLGSLNMDLTIQCVDLPKNGETINGSGFFINPGGKGGNQAVAAAKLGVDTYMIANLGNDVFGDQLFNVLQEYGVHMDGVHRDATHPSGVAMIIRSHNDNRIILGNGANHTLPFAHVCTKLDELARPNDIFLTQLENDYELVKKAIQEAKKIGMFTVLNPAPARMLDDEIYENLDLIVVNQSECKFLTGIYPNDEESSLEALHIFEKKHVYAIITLGTHGSISNYQGNYVFVAARKVETVDTTAAGDSYIGAICSYLVKGREMQEALEFATSVAAITVTRKGAQVSIPYQEEVEKYFKEEKHEETTYYY